MSDDGGGPDDLEALGARVAKARKGLGLSKEAAARQAGISSITWKRVEDGLPVQDTKLNQVLHVVKLDRPTRKEVPAEQLDAQFAALTAQIEDLTAMTREARERWLDLEDHLHELIRERDALLPHVYPGVVGADDEPVLVATSGEIMTSQEWARLHAPAWGPAPLRIDVHWSDPSLTLSADLAVRGTDDQLIAVIELKRFVDVPPPDLLRAAELRLARLANQLPDAPDVFVLGVQGRGVGVPEVLADRLLEASRSGWVSERSPRQLGSPETVVGKVGDPASLPQAARRGHNRGADVRRNLEGVGEESQDDGGEGPA